MNAHSDKKIVDSWEKNVAQWTAAVRNGEIESRKLSTNHAIIEAVLDYSPASVLDIGCGEGWLIRELSPYVSRLVGVDTVAGLIQKAEDAGGGEYIVASYDAIASGATTIDGLFDAVVCNFSLLGKESVEALMSAASSLIALNGVLIVQTLHPMFAVAESSYVDGWRDGSWEGFNASFLDPAPWYFRTLATWVALLSGSGLCLREVREPINPKTNKPASIIFVAARAQSVNHPTEK